MTFEIFLSYSRKDDIPQLPGHAKGWVTAIHAEILADHRRFSTEPLRIFFDTSIIQDMDNWRHRILEGLRQSRILLVCLSPNYFRSDYCRWEFDEYVRRQVHQLIGFDSFAQVYFVEVPNDPGTREGWYELLRQSNYTDLRPWFPVGIEALTDETVKQKLADLGTSLWKRIQRARRATGVGGNLRRLNPHFIGRTTELHQLHENLALGAVGVVTAINGLGGQGKTELAIAYAHSWADFYPAGLWVLSAEGSKELLPLFGVLCIELAIPLSAGAHETAHQRGRRVLAELKRRAIEGASRDPDRGGGCLVLLDNVSDPQLLSEPQLGQLPCEDWLRVIVTTREGQDKFHGSKQKSLAFIPVDALAEDDAVRLIEDHQPEGKWPAATAAADRAAARTIVSDLGGFTLAVESVAIYLGLHSDIRPTDYLARLRGLGLPSVDNLSSNADVAAQMQHREKQLHLVLEQTLTRLNPPERTALIFAAFLPPDSIPWPWLRHLVEQKHSDDLIIRPGYPDLWSTIRRRLEGLRLLTPGDHQEIARMHRLVAACVRELLPNLSAYSPLRDLVEFVSEIRTPFAYEIPTEIFLKTWNLLAETWPLQGRLMKKAAESRELCSAFAERWTDLSYHLGDTVLEEWWLAHWKNEPSPSNAFVGKKAAFLHRNGKIGDACSILQQHLQSRGQDFELSSQLMMYLAQLGRHEDASKLADRLELEHADILLKDKLLRARFLHHKGFILHELDKNCEVVTVSQFIREVYSDHHLTYDALISTVNLGDALWATGELSEAAELLRAALLRGQAFGLTQVENIAAICLANVLSSSGAIREAADLYTLGVSLSHRIGHRWDLIYGQAYQVLNDFEAGRTSADDLESIRAAAVEAGFEYLAAVADSHTCIASFVATTNQIYLKEAIRRGLKSPFPSFRLYALSAAFRAQLVSGHSPDPNRVVEWVKTLAVMQGVKGRIGVIARTAEWLIDAGVLDEKNRACVCDWIERYVPKSLVNFYATQYPLPKVTIMAKSENPEPQKVQDRANVRLQVCNLSQCEARCCYDGVYLEDGEEAKINEIVASEPEFFRNLPTNFIVEGSWGDGHVKGRKTAVEPHNFKAADFPTHFSRTRCVFCAEDHSCLLQVLAVERGLHKWAYKPKGCWTFPMNLVGGKPNPPPSISEPDPHCLGEEYPGYVKFVPCGQDRPDGDPWEQTLSEEIEYWNQMKSK